VILKVLREETSNATQVPSLLKKEADAMAALQGHPNIVGFHGIFWVSEANNDEGVGLPSWAMQIEYCQGGDLHDKVSATRFEESEAVPVMQAILRGLCHMHELGYVHRDIKPENILWAKGNVKIADFGICCHTSNEEEMKRICGSPGYIAPEIILKQPYGSKADCFSAGALLYFIVSGRLAFSGQDPRSTLKKTVRRPLNFQRSPHLACLSDGCKEFMLELMAKDPICRASSQKALESMWLSQGGLFSQASQTSCDVANASSCNLTDSTPQSDADRRELSGRSNSSTTYCPTTESKGIASQERSICPSQWSTFGSKERATCTSIESEKSEAGTDKITSLALLKPTRPEGRPMRFRSSLLRNLKPSSEGVVRTQSEVSHDL
jgi:serine/threonine protein kinase